MSDKRKKGCPNELCEMHKKEMKQKSEINYCSKCGTKLIYVCTKCFKEIENIDKKHRICYLCKAALKEKRLQRVDKIKKGTGATIALVTPIILDTANKVIKDGQKHATGAGVKVIRKAAGAIIRR